MDNVQLMYNTQLLHDAYLASTQELVRQVLRNASAYQWDIQGFGMLRTRLGKDLRLNIWDSTLAVPDVSLIHSHPWDFSSIICWGSLTNCVYDLATEESIEAAMLVNPCTTYRRYNQYSIKPGAEGGLLTEPVPVWLGVEELRTYSTGEAYAMQAPQIHHSAYQDGTVTLNYRRRVGEDEALVFELERKPWVSAKPRPATPEEVAEFVTAATMCHLTSFGKSINA